MNSLHVTVVKTKLASYRYVSHIPQSRNWERKIAEGPPCVVLASPGFMETGPSRELLELWAPDVRNGLIVTGYSVEGTMARVSLSPLPYEYNQYLISSYLLA
jgi:Cft2 family RNA processing exonuclease